MRRRMFVGAAFCRPFICFSRLKHSTHYVIMEFNKKYGGGSTIEGAALELPPREKFPWNRKK